MTQTVTLEVPNGLYVHIKKRAEHANRSVEDEVLDVLAATVSTPETDHRETIAALELLDTPALERAARSHLLAEFAAELESLHLKQQREPLTAAESKRAAELIHAYEQAMLIRAHAAVLLKERGMDVSHLVAQP